MRIAKSGCSAAWFIAPVWGTGDRGFKSHHSDCWEVSMNALFGDGSPQKFLFDLFSGLGGIAVACFILFAIGSAFWAYCEYADKRDREKNKHD